MPLKIDKISSLPIVTDADGTWLVTFNETTGKNERFKVSRLMVTGEYGDIKNIPPETTPSIWAVTNMFSSNHPNGYFEAWMKTNFATGKRTIEILARPDPEAAVNMVITPDFGFGAAVSEYPPLIPYAVLDADGYPVLDVDGNPTVKNYLLEIDAEGAPVDDNGNAVTTASIIIPRTCPQAEVKYLVGSGSLIGISFIVDNDSVYHRFHAATTPLDNLTAYEVNDSYILDGVSVPKPNIREIHLGDSYHVATALPTRFIRGLNSLTALDLTPLSSVESIGDECFNALNALPYLDATPLKSVTAIGNGYLSWMNSLTELHVDWSNLTTVGSYFCFQLTALKNLDISTLPATVQLQYPSFVNLSSLESIQLGGVDRSSQGSLVGNFYGFPPTGTLYADTQAVADAFIAKVPAVAGWTVVLNS